MANKLLKNSPKQNVFWLANGTTLKSIKELMKALDKMDEGLYSYHANTGKNDFANWIKDIFQDTVLADRLKNALNKGECLDIIRVRLEEIKPKKKKH